MTQAATNWIKARKVLIKNGDFRHLFDGIDRTTSADVVKMLDDAGIKWLNFDYVPQGSYFSSPIKSFAVPAGVTDIASSAFELSTLEEVSLPEGLLAIQSRAFADTFLKEVNIPSSVDLISNYAFGATSLTKLEIHTNTSLLIGTGAFYFNRQLEEVDINCSKDFDIGAEAFGHCTALRKVTLGRALRSLGGLVFSGCPNLRTIEFKGTKAEWALVALPADALGSVEAIQCADGEIRLVL